MSTLSSGTVLLYHLIVESVTDRFILKEKRSELCSKFEPKQM